MRSPAEGCNDQPKNHLFLIAGECPPNMPGPHAGLSDALFRQVKFGENSPNPEEVPGYRPKFNESHIHETESI